MAVATGEVITFSINKGGVPELEGMYGPVDVPELPDVVTPDFLSGETSDTLPSSAMADMNEDVPGTPKDVPAETEKKGSRNRNAARAVALVAASFALMANEGCDAGDTFGQTWEEGSDFSNHPFNEPERAAGGHTRSGSGGGSESSVCSQDYPLGDLDAQREYRARCTGSSKSAERSGGSSGGGGDLCDGAYPLGDLGAQRQYREQCVGD